MWTFILEMLRIARRQRFCFQNEIKRLLGTLVWKRLFICTTCQGEITVISALKNTACRISTSSLAYPTEVSGLATAVPIKPNSCDGRAPGVKMSPECLDMFKAFDCFKQCDVNAGKTRCDCSLPLLSWNGVDTQIYSRRLPTNTWPVVLFQRKFRQGQPENCLFPFSKRTVSGWKYPKNIWFYSKNRSTAHFSRYILALCNWKGAAQWFCLFKSKYHLFQLFSSHKWFRV